MTTTNTKPTTTTASTTPSRTAPSGIDITVNYRSKATKLPGDTGNKSYPNVPYFVALCINALLHIPAPK